MTAHSTHAPNAMLGTKATLQWSEGQLAALEILEDHLPEQVKSGAVLEAIGISKAFGGLQALGDAGLTIEAAQTTGLIGPNGAGKSTFFDCVTGFTSPDTGSVHAFGHDVTTRSPWKRAQIGMARTFQANHIAPGLTVEENLRVAATRRRGRWGVESVLELFPMLQARRRALAATLSGGEQQAVAIGRALMSNPRLLLLDEVSLGLAPVVVDAVYRSLQGIIEEGATVVLVEQDLTRALQVAGRVVCLLEGRVVLEGAAASLDRERVVSAYFGLKRSA